MDRRSPEAVEYRKLYKLKAWERLRRRKLNDQPLCARHQARGKVKAATVVNHKVPHKGDRRLFFDYDNLESTCAECHDSIIQSEERLGYSKEIGNDGWPIDSGHPFNDR